MQIEPHLNDLREWRDAIAKTGGIEPDNFHEFCRKLPEAPSNRLGSALSTALRGAALMGGLAAMMLGIDAVAVFAIGGALMGGLISLINSSEPMQRVRDVKTYKKYLDRCEQSVGQGRAYSIDKMPPAREGEQVAKLRERDDMMRTVAGASPSL